MKQIFDTTTNALAAAANFRSLKHNVVSSNIANAETPGYKSKVVEFEDALARAIDLEGLNKQANLDPDHYAMGTGSISRARADVYDNPVPNVTNDQNTVDLEQEMAALQENTIMYKAALQLMNRKIGAMKYAVSEGTR